MVNRGYVDVVVMVVIVGSAMVGPGVTIILVGSATGSGRATSDMLGYIGFTTTRFTAAARQGGRGSGVETEHASIKQLK